MCARSACVASCSRDAIAKQTTSVVTIAFILLRAAGCTQNGGSVAQRQFCRGRQNCRASNRNYEKSIEIEKSTRELLWDL